MYEHENTADANTHACTHGHKKKFPSRSQKQTHGNTYQICSRRIHRYRCTLQQHRTCAEMEPGTADAHTQSDAHTAIDMQTSNRDTSTHRDILTDTCIDGHTRTLPAKTDSSVQMRIKACTDCKCSPAYAYPRSTWTPIQLMYPLGTVTNPLVKKLWTALFEASLALKPSTRARLGK